MTKENHEKGAPTAFLLDLVTNRKIPITTPRCRVGRDKLNDIVIDSDVLKIGLSLYWIIIENQTVTAV